MLLPKLISFNLPPFKVLPHDSFTGSFIPSEELPKILGKGMIRIVHIQ